MNIYFLRHGQTEENIKGTYYGSLDVGLGEKGIEEAKEASSILKNIAFDRVYTSGLKRTIETADIVIGQGTYEIIKDSRINEKSFGIFEGKTYEEIGDLYPKELEKWTNNWKYYCPEGGESYEMFYKRVKSFMDEIKETSLENILVITHGGVIRAVYCYILEENLDFYWRFASKNGDLTLIKYEDKYFYIDSIQHIC